MSSFATKKAFARRVAWACASLLLAGCEVGSSTKSTQPYRAPSAGKTGINAGSGTAEVGSWLSLSISVNDKNGFGIANVVPTVTAVNNFTGTSAGVTSGGCGTTNNLGVTSCTLKATTAGTYTVSVVTPVQTTSPTPVSFYQVPRSLGFVPSPSSSTASKTVFATQPTVAVYDAVGALIPNGVTVGKGGTGVVTLSLNSTTGGILLPSSAPTATTNSSGYAVFSGLNIDLTGTYTLTASLTDPVSGTITGTSSSFSIVAGAAVGFHFRTSPTSATTGVAFGTMPVVTPVDAQGNDVLTDNTCVVTLSLYSPNAGDLLLGNVLQAKMVSGVADFSKANLRVSRTGSGTSSDLYHLIVTGGTSCAGVLNGKTANSSDFTVSLAGLPAQLTVIQSPENTSLNNVWTQQPILQVLDINGNLVASDNTTVVTMTKVVGSPAGFVVGTTSAQAVNGVVTFSGLSIPASTAQAAFAGTYTYLFHGYNNSLSIADATTSHVVDANGLIPDHVKFKAQPVGPVAINQVLPTFSVQTVDANGYFCAFDNSSKVSLTANGPYIGAPYATTTNVSVVNGVATFSSTSFGAAGAWQLVAQAETSGGATFGSLAYSNVFLVNTHAATADHLKFLTQPSAQVSGNNSPWDTQPIVAVVDAQNNVMTDDNTTLITLDCTLPSGCAGKLVGNPSMRVTNGIANFAAAGLHLGGGAYGNSPVLGEVVSATSQPAMPVAPTYSTQFNEAH